MLTLNSAESVHYARSVLIWDRMASHGASLLVGAVSCVVTV